MPKKGPELVDQTAKLIAELDIEGLLELMGIDPGAEILESEPVQRELTLPQMRMDHASRLTLRGVEGKVIHVIEFLGRWADDAGERARLYGRAVEVKYQLPVNCVVALLTARGAPPRIPRVHSYGPLDRHRFRYDVFRPWRIPARRILAMGRPQLYPLIALARHSRKDLIEAKRRLGGRENVEIQQRLMTFATLYYTQDQILEIFGEGNSMIMEEIVKESPVLQEIMQEMMQESIARAHAKGVESGRRTWMRKGRVEQAREMLRSCLADQFPELAGMPEIDRFNAEEAKNVLLHVIKAKSAKSAREIIRKASVRA